jgi:O-antigen ligase
MTNAPENLRQGPPEPAEPIRPEPLERDRRTERVERVCDAVILALLVGAVVLASIAFGGADQDLAPFSKAPFGTILYYFNYTIAAAAVLMVLVWGIKMLLTERLVLARTPIDIPLVLFLVYALVRALTCAAPTVAIREVGWLTAYAAIFYVTVNVLRTRRKQHLVVGAIVGTALVLSIVGLVLMLRLETRDLALTLQRPQQYHGRLGATYVCPNHFAGLLELTIPLVLATIMIGKARLVHKMLAGAAGLAMVTAFIFTMSRGAWISLALGIIFLLAAATLNKRIKLLAWLVPLVVIITIVAAIIASDPTVRHRFSIVFDEDDASYAGRALTWKHTLDVVRRHPLVGTGPGTYRWAFTRVQPPDLVLDVRYAHNDYLHTLSDYGLIGFGLVLWAVGSFAYRGVRALRRAKKSADLALATGVMASAVAIAGHSFVDFNMHIPANLVIMLVLAAVLIAVRQYQLRRMGELVLFKRTGTRRLPTAVKAAAITALVLAAAAILLVNGRKHAARIAHHRGREIDMTLARPVGLKDRVIDRVLALEEITPKQREPIVKALSMLDWPMMRDVEWRLRTTGREAKLEPEEIEALVRAGRAARNMTDEDQQQIVAAYRRAIRLDESNFEFHAALLNYFVYVGQNKLFNHQSLGELTRGLPYGLEAAGLNPLSATVAFNMAELYREMYDRLNREDLLNLIDETAYQPLDYYRDKAREWYEITAKLHPESGAYREGYGDFLALAGDLRAALGQYEQAVKVFGSMRRYETVFENGIEQTKLTHDPFRIHIRRIEGKIERIKAKLRSQARTGRPGSAPGKRPREAGLSTSSAGPSRPSDGRTSDDRSG